MVIHQDHLQDQLEKSFSIADSVVNSIFSIFTAYEQILFLLAGAKRAALDVGWSQARRRRRQILN